MPSLTILAGPNGAGKTRTTDLLLSLKYLSKIPVDLDLLVSQAIDDLPHSYYGADSRLDKSVDKLFLNYCIEAIKNNNDFCFECNFRKDQLKYAGLFEEAGYKLILLFFLLNSIDQSKQRVGFRYNNEGGKNVDIVSIQENFKQGLSNLDNNYQDFQQVIIIDNSQDNYSDTYHTLNVQLNIDGNNVTCYNKNFPSKEVMIFLPKISALVKKNL
jgi:predicted ABC-type ATPase